MTTLTRRSFLLTAASASLGNTALLSHAVPKADSLVISAAPDAPFRILQITDLHFFDKNAAINDAKTTTLIEGLINHFSPNLIAVTGDVWSNDQGGKGLHFCETSATRFDAFGIPWIFAWGNHDEVQDRPKAHAILEGTSHALYSRGDGNGNYRVELQDQTNHKPLWQFFMLNTEKVGLSSRETMWLQNECQSLPKTPGFIFCHIPVLQYDTIWESGTAVGIKYEKVCNEEETGTALPEIAKTGAVQAMFVGHDHVNDYSGLHSNINLVYGRATGFGGYGADKVEKGGTLIEIHPEKQTYDYMSVFPDGRTWKQKKESQE
ncbi:MAG: metallophosphoesterase [bacterium]|jgi:hypothetical protein|nr:metallophosphoesterase [bacterium]